MRDLQAIADRVEVEALPGEFTDAVMMHDHDRLASRFTRDGALRIPDANIELGGRQGIRALGERREALTDYFVQTTHPGMIRLDGDTASGRVYTSELIHSRDGNSYLNYAVDDDRYQRARTAGSSPSASTRSGTRHQSAGGLGRPTPRGRPLTRRPGTCLRRRRTVTMGFTIVPGTWDPGPVHPGARFGVSIAVGGFAGGRLGGRRGCGCR